MRPTNGNLSEILNIQLDTKSPSEDIFFKFTGMGILIKSLPHSRTIELPSTPRNIDWRHKRVRGFASMNEAKQREVASLGGMMESERRARNLEARHGESIKQTITEYLVADALIHLSDM